MRNQKSMKMIVRMKLCFKNNEKFNANLKLSLTKIKTSRKNIVKYVVVEKKTDQIFANLIQRMGLSGRSVAVLTCLFLFGLSPSTTWEVIWSGISGWKFAFRLLNFTVWLPKNNPAVCFLWVHYDPDLKLENFHKSANSRLYRVETI